MGYDANECMKCYCQGNGNCKTNHSFSVCLTCVVKITNNGVTYRVVNALGTPTIIQCELCSLNDCIGFSEVSLCNECKEPRFP